VKQAKATLIALDAANASEKPGPSGMFDARLSPRELEQLDKIRGIRENQAFDLPLSELRRLADLQLLQNAAAISAQPAEAKPLNNAAKKMRIGQNIDKLRKECGWSYDMLAEKIVGQDGARNVKNRIMSNAHGRSMPHPKTLREYAQAFSKELKRSITANSLEE